MPRRSMTKRVLPSVLGRPLHPPERPGAGHVFQVAQFTAGLEVGDILVTYNEQPIIDADEAVQAIQSAPASGEVLVEWLRLEASGRLVRQQTRVPSGKLGIAMMLI